jgi:hypothetical protein
MADKDNSDYSELWKERHTKHLIEVEKDFPKRNKKKKLIISATRYIEDRITKAHSKEQ